MTTFMYHDDDIIIPIQHNWYIIMLFYISI